MVPAFRFLAYYFIANQGRQEIVADSVWVDVMDVCEGKVNSEQVASDFVFQNNNKNIISREYRPGVEMWKAWWTFSFLFKEGIIVILDKRCSW